MSEQMNPAPPKASDTQRLFFIRLAIGLAQGVSLYFLYLAAEDRLWPAANGLIYSPLLLVSMFVPLIAIQAMGTMRVKTLSVWLTASTLLLAALAFYDVWRAWPLDWTYNASQKLGADGKTMENVGGWVPHIMPSAFFLILTTAGLFIAHTLIVSSDHDRKFKASYVSYFDDAWKHGIQVVLTGAFVGVFWVFLWIGVALFKLIKLDFLEQLIEHLWFSIPVTALAVAASLHITGVNAGLIRGARTLALTLLSWLLPLLSIIVFGFLFALPFAGIDLLWGTKSAAALMLSAAAILLILINAVYQDDTQARNPGAVLRFFTTISMFAPVPLVALAAYAIALRVGQHGWTSERVLAVACVVTAAFYAIGYSYAAIRRGAWLEFVGDWNFYAALFILALFVALLSPVADPARIGVASQMNRLTGSVVKASAFDFSNLRWDGGRYGKAALERLLEYEGDGHELVRTNARAALDAHYHYDVSSIRPDVETLKMSITTLDGDAKIPDAFFEQDWFADKRTELPSCLNYLTSLCTARMIDLDKDGTKEIILSDRSAVYAFKTDEAGHWASIGKWRQTQYCPATIDALNKGKYELAPPPKVVLPDILVGNERLVFESFEKRQGC
ncbi:MAG: DUF4153 domain-containing protein [Parvibaculum sp.]|nr:DUF4153 domain-containing protein [Parvibaculum sp.]